MATFWKRANGPRMKYRNRHTRCDRGMKAHTHDSMAERDRCFVLHLKQEQGEISGLMIHERFKLEVNGVLITTYEADFSYTIGGSLIRFVVEDVKGVKTRDYVIKARLMLAIHGIDIVEVS
jgi:hypothetical protein